ncbi:MAG TPA: hypothetical protein VGY55_10825 [Pirellulales bacterium]|jgi:hypothetical protein|nr:hypothetical protein [Pirellulales bacterium]
MTDDRHPQQEPSNTSTAFEPSDASIRGIVISGAVLGMVSVAIMLAMVRAFDLFARNAGGAPGRETETTAREMRWPRAPRLEGLPPELADKQSRIDASHAGYGWIDQKRQIARIPIEEAMKLLVSESPAPPTGKQPANERLEFQRTHPPGPSSSGRVANGE